VAEQPLSDVKILDLTWYIAGPWCTRLLADYGADVIKVERPGAGDPARRLGPFLGDSPDPERSGLFLHLNLNKRGITLNLKSQTGKKILKDLVKDADILVESFRPGVMERLGLGYEELALNPRLVMTSISNFGQNGPYRDFKASELIINAMGHTMSSCGLPSREPIKRGANALQYQSGQMAAAATMGALTVSRLQGIGQQVDVSMMETHASSVDYRTQNLLGYIYTGQECPRVDPREAGVSIMPYGVLPCKDGFVQWLMTTRVHWARLCELLGEEQAEMDRRFPDLYDMTRKGELEAMTANWCSTRTKWEVMEEAQASRLPATAVFTPADLVQDPHFEERQLFVEAEHPAAGKLKYTGAVFKIGGIPWEVRRPAPLLGQHNAEVYGGLGYAGEDLVKLREMGVI